MSSERAVITAAWNRHRLRHGEHIIAGDKPNQGNRQGKHPSRWTADGCVLFAFGRLFATTSKKGRPSSRVLDACALTQVAFTDRQQQHLHGLCLQVRSSNPCMAWLWVARAWDETPIAVNFGLCTPEARPVARYWWHDPAPRNGAGRGPAAGRGHPELSQRPPRPPARRPPCPPAARPPACPPVAPEDTKWIRTKCVKGTFNQTLCLHMFRPHCSTGNRGFATRGVLTGGFWIPPSRSWPMGQAHVRGVSDAGFR